MKKLFLRNHYRVAFQRFQEFQLEIIFSNSLGEKNLENHLFLFHLFFYQLKLN